MRTPPPAGPIEKRMLEELARIESYNLTLDPDTKKIMEGKIVQDAMDQTKGSAFHHVPEAIRTNKAFVKFNINKFPAVFSLIPDSLLDDKEFIFDIFKTRFRSNLQAFLDNSPPALFNHPALVKALCEEIPELFNRLAPRVGNNPQLLLWMIEKEPNIFKLHPEKFEKNEALMIEAVKRKREFFNDIPTSLKKNKQFMNSMAVQNNDDADVILTAMTIDSIALPDASNRLKDNEQFMLNVIKKDMNAIEFASERLKDNKTFMIEAAKINGRVLLSASNRLQNDMPFMLEAISLLQNIQPNLTSNESILCKEMVDTLVTQIKQGILTDENQIKQIINIMPSKGVLDLLEVDKNYFSYVRPDMKEDENFISKVIEKKPAMFLSLPEKWKHNQAFKLNLCKSNGLLIQFIENTYLNKELVKAAVMQNSEIFPLVKDFMTKRLTEDDREEIALAIVKDNGLNLKNIPIDILTKGTIRRIIKAAIEENGLALEHVPAEYMHIPLAELAITQNPLASKYAPADYQYEGGVIAQAKKKEQDDIALAPIKKNKIAFLRLDEKYQADNDFLLRVLQEAFEGKQKDFFDYAPKTVCKNKNTLFQSTPIEKPTDENEQTRQQGPGK